MIAFHTTVAVRRPLPDVFAYVADPRTFPAWNSAVQAVTSTSAGPADAGATYAMERQLPGGRALNDLEIVAYEPPVEFAIRTTAGPTPFHYRYRFAAQDGHTVVALDAEVELSGVAAIAPALARRAVKRGVDDNLATLKRTLEAASG